jgi:hypothetical protein
MPNDPNSNRNDPNEYRSGKSSSGWTIAGIIALVVVGIALYQNHIHNANNMANIEPAAGSMSNTNTNTDMTNTMGNTTNTTTNTTNTTP